MGKKYLYILQFQDILHCTLHGVYLKKSYSLYDFSCHNLCRYQGDLNILKWIFYVALLYSETLAWTLEQHIPLRYSSNLAFGEFQGDAVINFFILSLAAVPNC